MIRKIRSTAFIAWKWMDHCEACAHCRMAHVPREVQRGISNRSFFSSSTALGNADKTKSTAPKPSRTEYLFGVGPCLLALCSSRRKTDKVYINDGASNTSSRPEFSRIKDIAAESNIPVVSCSKRKLMNLSEGRPHQNIVMKVSPLKFSELPDKEGNFTKDSTKPPLILALDEIQDPMNFGAIIRTSFLLGVDKIVVPARNSAPLSPVVSKASAGAMEVFPVYQTPVLDKFLQNRAQAGWEILGAVQPTIQNSQGQSPLSCADYRMAKPTILVLGNEGQGIRRQVLQHCNQFISIYPTRSPLFPVLDGDTSRMAAGLDSLNVSVATGVLVHSILKNTQ